MVPPIGVALPEPAAPAVGANCTETVQEAPTARVAPEQPSAAREKLGFDKLIAGEAITITGNVGIEEFVTVT
jgi:hypothetical protein